MKEKSSWKSSVSGFIAGCATMSLFPLEKMKIHMIVSEKSSRNLIPYYPSTIHLFHAMKQKGLRYMYRGFHLQLSASIAWANYFYIYEFFKKLPSTEFRTNHYELYKFTVAAQSAIIGNFMSNPLFVIKTRALLLQNSENWFKDTIESLIKTYKVDGIRGFWRGYSVGLILAFDGTLSMYLYESFKELNFFNDLTLNSGFAGSLSKCLACSFFFPVVLLKMRLQQEQHISAIPLKSSQIKGKVGGKTIYEGVINCVQDIWRNEGFKGFYRGLPITLIKVTPTQALFFITYETTYKFLDNV